MAVHISTLIYCNTPIGNRWQARLFHSLKQLKIIFSKGYQMWPSLAETNEHRCSFPFNSLFISGGFLPPEKSSLIFGVVMDGGDHSPFLRPRHFPKQMISQAHINTLMNLTHTLIYCTYINCGLKICDHDASLFSHFLH